MSGILTCVKVSLVCFLCDLLSVVGGTLNGQSILEINIELSRCGIFWKKAVL